MAAVVGGMELQVKATGSSCTVPNNCKAKLMYYLQCLYSCMETDSDPTISRLTDYQNYYRLSAEEEAMLLARCTTLSPNKFNGKVIFPVDDVNLGAQNEFFELSAVNTKLLVSESFIIGGQQRRVLKIMMYKKSWLEYYYYQPFRSLKTRVQMASRPHHVNSTGTGAQSTASARPTQSFYTERPKFTSSYTNYDAIEPPSRCCEILVLLAAMAFSLGALVAAVMAEIRFKEFVGPLDRVSVVGELSFFNELFLKTEATAGLVFATTGLLWIFGIVPIIRRMCSHQRVNTGYRIILTCLYLFFILLCFSGYAAAGVLGSLISKDWSNITSVFGPNALYNSIAAMAACSVLTALMLLTDVIVFLSCCARNKEY